MNINQGESVYDKHSPPNSHMRDRLHHVVLWRKFVQVLRQRTQDRRRVMHVTPLGSYP